MRWDQKLSSIVHQNDSLLCVGLDSDITKVPAHLRCDKNPVVTFNKAIIEATKDSVCAYKLNLAFYEVLGEACHRTLTDTIAVIPSSVFIILDGKRNDIGNTAEQYAKALFDTYGADAATVNPYLGKDGVDPFLKYADKCSFILCRTSNPSAADFQDLQVGSTPLYQHVAKKIAAWDTAHNCGAVVGATYPEELRTVRGLLGEAVPILIPGVGKQGGDVEKTVRHGTTAKGDGALINSSRDVLFASGGEGFAEAAFAKAESLRKVINAYRPKG